MMTAFAIVLVVHGLIHLLGTAKAFGWIDLPQLTQPISVTVGAVWLMSALLFMATAVSMFVWSRWWWAIGLCAVVVSTLVILPSWTDAKVGILANGLIVVGLVFGFLSQGPFSLRGEYDRDVERHVSFDPSPAVTEAALVHLPALLQQYLRRAGVVGQPRVRNFLVRMHGRIRDGRQGRWMPFASEQYNVVNPPARLFYLNASMFAIPVQGYHRYVEASASMRVKAAALVPVAAAEGDQMTQAETVTLFNDMCIMAPATLIDPALEWEAVDARTVKGRFTHAGHTIAAMLSFDDAGELTNFVSDDRFQTSAANKTTRQVRWSTPVHDYRTYGAVRLASRGEGQWHDAEGHYAYIELTIDDVQYNVRPR